MRSWVKMPAAWVRDMNKFPLHSLLWVRGASANNTAALMIYIVLVHKADDNLKADGCCGPTYSEIRQITGLSRSKISGGLQVLYDLGIIANISVGKTNRYKLPKYEAQSGWAKLPARALYTKDGRFRPFMNMSLRSKYELYALKIYLLLVAQRDIVTNFANIGYDKIHLYTAVPRNDIRSSLSWLVNSDLINVDASMSQINEFGTKNIYRIKHIEPYKHRGTTGRANLIPMEFDN